MTLFNLKDNRFAPKTKKTNRKGFVNGIDTWTREVDPEHLKEIKMDIIQGRSHKFILLKMNTMGYWLDVKYSTAKKRITRYYRNCIREEASARGEWLPPHRLTRGIDVQSEMEILIAQQKKRIKKLRGREKKTPLLLEQVTREVDVLNGMLDKLARLQMHTGNLPKATIVKTSKVSADPNNPHGLIVRSTETLLSRLDELDKEFE